jgi:hypothetical protein
LLIGSTSAFVSLLGLPNPICTPQEKASCVSLFVFGGGKKKEEEDLSYIETRDMTREEMLKYNEQSENIMNAEIVGMTFFSLVISAPLLYLAWVGLFAETNQVAGDLSGL